MKEGNKQEKKSGQSVRFLENNGNHNASLYVEAGIFSFESSGLLVLWQAKDTKKGGQLNELR